MNGTIKGGAPLVLASGSAHRARLLRAAGLALVVAPPDLDEAPLKARLRATGQGADRAALALARAKAEVVLPQYPGSLVIGSDQIAALGDRWLDKPRDLAAARAQLGALRGQTHVLETAVVVMRDGQVVWSHLARPRLTMRAFSDAALEAALTADGDSLLSCVGAYRIEGPGIQLFEAVEGDVFAIQGLPLLPLLGALRAQGALPS